MRLASSAITPNLRLTRHSAELYDGRWGPERRAHGSELLEAAPKSGACPFGRCLPAQPTTPCPSGELPYRDHSARSRLGPARPAPQLTLPRLTASMDASVPGLRRIPMACPCWCPARELRFITCASYIEPMHVVEPLWRHARDCEPSYTHCSTRALPLVLHLQDRRPSFLFFVPTCLIARPALVPRTCFSLVRQSRPSLTAHTRAPRSAPVVTRLFHFNLCLPLSSACEGDCSPLLPSTQLLRPVILTDPGSSQPQLLQAARILHKQAFIFGSLPSGCLQKEDRFSSIPGFRIACRPPIASPPLVRGSSNYT
ncbi:hypothetical protein B0J12DRAFT_112605 [Macrophomina phaseolina]|uniref:Uncharacterized protein n=1 Tax=Macrophomina phaseolina TaxID=35725 RepID=A0ABQ8G8M5_9PEZI|nr:hypothetical protein B0J12DRAFT_112605 [Macrophomina phaseolina]